MATAEEFFAIDVRVGTVLEVEPFPESRKRSIKLLIDFGAGIGTTRTNLRSSHTEVVLLSLDQPVANGTRIG